MTFRFVAATVKCHPKYAAHLMKKDTIGIEKTEKKIDLIPRENRSGYNEKLIEQMRCTYASKIVALMMSRL